MWNADQYVIGTLEASGNHGAPADDVFDRVFRRNFAIRPEGAEISQPRAQPWVLDGPERSKP